MPLAVLAVAHLTARGAGSGYGARGRPRGAPTPIRGEPREPHPSTLQVAAARQNDCDGVAFRGGGVSLAGLPISTAGPFDTTAARSLGGTGSPMAIRRVISSAIKGAARLGVAAPASEANSTRSWLVSRQKSHQEPATPAAFLATFFLVSKPAASATPVRAGAAACRPLPPVSLTPLAFVNGAPTSATSAALPTPP